ncbi:hypothetical protein [Stackebrandtia albiflava]|nr:hypothetical protein [Stackebrandtia albiflava]
MRRPGRGAGESVDKAMPILRLTGTDAVSIVGMGLPTGEPPSPPGDRR